MSVKGVRSALMLQMRPFRGMQENVNEAAASVRAAADRWPSGRIDQAAGAVTLLALVGAVALVVWIVRSA